MESALAALIPTLSFRTADCGHATLGLANQANGPTPADYAQSSCGQIHCAAVARLDNRETLRERLSAHLFGTAPSNAELILTAYRHWGEDCAHHLRGDFAFVIVDEQSHRALLARDPFGIKPLFIAVQPDAIFFASDIAALVAHPRINASLDDEALRSYLRAGDILDPKATFFAGIEKLPAANTLIIDKNRCRTQRYWQPADLDQHAPRIEPHDIIEGLDQHLQAAVSARLPESGSVGAHLSGGLDSSAIVAMAARQAGSERLRCWTWLHPPTDEDSVHAREWRLPVAVAQHCDVNLQHATLTPEDLCNILQASPLSRMDTADLYSEVPVRRAARDQGVSVMLSGWGGDECVSYHGATALADRFWSGQPVSALREIGARSGGWHPKRLTALLWREVLRPVLPQRRAVTPDFARFAQSAWVQPQKHSAWGLSTVRLHRQIDEALERGHLQARILSWAISGERDGIEYRYPLLDLDLLAFMRRLPPEHFRSAGRGRHLFRTVAARYLPDEVAQAPLQREQTRITELQTILNASLGQLMDNMEDDCDSRVDYPALHSFARSGSIGPAAAPHHAAAVRAYSVLSLAKSGEIEHKSMDA